MRPELPQLFEQLGAVAWASEGGGVTQPRELSLVERGIGFRFEGTDKELHVSGTTQLCQTCIEVAGEAGPEYSNPDLQAHQGSALRRQSSCACVSSARLRACPFCTHPPLCPQTASAQGRSPQPRNRDNAPTRPFSTTPKS